MPVFKYRDPQTGEWINVAGGGPSPYEIAKKNGYTGSEEEFNKLLATLDQNATESSVGEAISQHNSDASAHQDIRDLIDTKIETAIGLAIGGSY